MENQNLSGHDSLNQPFRTNNFKILDGNSSMLQRRLRKNQVLASLDSQIINDSVEKNQKEKLNSSVISNVKALRNRGEILVQEESQKQQFNYHAINSKCRLSSLQTSQEGNLITVNNSDYSSEFSKRGNGNISTEPSSSKALNMRNQRQELLQDQGNQIDKSMKDQGNREKTWNNQTASNNTIMNKNENNLKVTDNILDDYDSARITFYPKQPQLELQQQQEEQKCQEQVQCDQLPHHKQRTAQTRLPSEAQIYGSSQTGIAEIDSIQCADDRLQLLNYRPQSLPPFQKIVKQYNPLRTSHPAVQAIPEKVVEKENISQGKKEKHVNDQQQQIAFDAFLHAQLLKQQLEGSSANQLNNMTFHNLFQKNLASAHNIPAFGERKRSVNYTEFDRLRIQQSKQIQTSLSQNSSSLARRNTTATPIKKCTIRRQKYDEEQNNSLLQAYDPVKVESIHNHKKKTHKTYNQQQLCISVEQITRDGVGNRDNLVWNHFSETKQAKEEIELRKHQHTSDLLSSPLNEYPKNGKRSIIAQHIRLSQNSNSLDASLSRNNKNEEQIQSGMKLLDSKNGLSLDDEIQVGISKGGDNKSGGDKVMKNKNSISSKHSSISSEINKSNRILNQFQQTFSILEQKEITSTQVQQQQSQQEFNLPSLVDNHQQNRISYLASIQQYNQQQQQQLAGKGKQQQLQLNERASSLKGPGKKDNQNLEKQLFKAGQIGYLTLNNSPIAKTKTLPQQQVSENFEFLAAQNLTDNNEEENLLQETGKFGQQNSQQQLKQAVVAGEGGLGAGASCIGKEWIVSLDNIFKANKRPDIFNKQVLHQHMFSKASTAAVATKKDNSFVKPNNISNNNSKHEGSQLVAKLKPQLLPISVQQDGISKAITDNSRNIQQQDRNTNQSNNNGLTPAQRLGAHSTKATSNNPFPDPRLGTLLIHYNFPLQDNSLSNIHSKSQNQQAQQQQLQTQIIPPVHKKVSSAATCCRKYDFYHDSSNPFCDLQSQNNNALNIDVQPPGEFKNSQQRARSSNNRFPREIFTPNVSKAKRLYSQNPSTLQGQTYQLEESENYNNNNANEFL